MPIAMIASLVICTVIYILVALVLTGMLKWTELGTAEPLATAFSALGMHWAAGVISLGAVFATTSVLVVFQLGQPRIFFSMARDGLLPQWAAHVHPKYRTPHVTTILTGAVVAIFATFMNINEVVELTNIGTLFAFVLVALGVIVLRRDEPGRPRPFRTPLGAVGAAVRGHHVHLPHVPVAAGDVGALRHLAGHRPAHLFRLRRPPQRAADRPAGRSLTSWARPRRSPSGPTREGEGGRRRVP